METTSKPGWVVRVPVTQVEAVSVTADDEDEARQRAYEIIALRHGKDSYRIDAPGVSVSPL